MRSLLALLCITALLCAASLLALPSRRCGPDDTAGPSLEVMAGQMIVCGFRGTDENPLSEDLVLLLEDIRAGRVGGVILFNVDAVTRQPGRNVVSLEQVGRLAALLQKEAPIPLFVSVDQEGGRVRRLREEHGVPATPSARELGARDPRNTRQEAEKLGALLHHAGINLNFAPCLDVDVNPRSPAIGDKDRSFSADPKIVAAHGRAFAEGLFSAGVIPCYKHFPGHGSAAEDSHLGVTDISRTWIEEELAPYRELLPGAPPSMVMVGHVLHEELSGDLPASLSPRTIQKYLREDLGWQGVVITDDLQMQAVEGSLDRKEALRLAVLAGVDILLSGNNLRHDPQEARAMHAALVDLARNGEIPEGRIRESYKRIMALKSVAGFF